MIKRFPFYKQLNGHDCGPLCLRIIAKHYGKIWSLEAIKNICKVGEGGSSLYEINTTAKKMGFHSLAIKVPSSKIPKIPPPFILFVNKSHFVVVYGFEKNKILISDPAIGLVNYQYSRFSKKLEGEGVILTLEPK